jgi:hypothetical protein
MPRPTDLGVFVGLQQPDLPPNYFDGGAQCPKELTVR